MGFKNIEKKSLGYKLLYIWTQFWHNIVFYRKVIVLNKDNIPVSDNVIFTPNHQNALMDATALLFTIPRQLVFMARADIFAKPAIAAILYFLKILPIYRSRDGKQEVKKNEAVFRRTVDVLTAGNGLVILPEGSHEGVHRLRPLKKGFARIAFQTEELNDFSLDIKIVPVGIDYSNYQDFRSELLVNFGPPLAVRDFYPLYKENPARAMNALKDALAERIKTLIVHIESSDYYDLYDELKDIYNQRMCDRLGLPDAKQPNKLKAGQEFVRLLSRFEKERPQEIPGLYELVKNYSNKRNQLGLTDDLIAKGKISLSEILPKLVLLLLVLPLFVYGWLNHILPWGITVRAGKKIKDPQFKSSFKFAVSLLVFPVFYLIQTLVAVFVFETWWVWWAYLLSLPVSAIVAWWWHAAFLRLKKNWRFYRLSKKSSTDYAQMVADYNQIIEKAEEITSI